VTALGITATDVTLRRIHSNLVALEKSINIAYSGCVFVALGILHTKRMRHIFICGLFGSAAFFPPHYLINGTIFGKKLLNTK
jgi:hypothetical protein